MLFNLCLKRVNVIDSEASSELRWNFTQMSYFKNADRELFLESMEVTQALSIYV